MILTVYNPINPYDSSYRLLFSKHKMLSRTVFYIQLLKKIDKNENVKSHQHIKHLNHRSSHRKCYVKKAVP